MPGVQKEISKYVFVLLNFHIVVELVGGGSVIKGKRLTSSSYYREE